MVAPLTKTDKNNNPLRRPPEIEAEIETAIALEPGEILLVAGQTNPDSRPYMSSECMVHLIRQDFHSGRFQLLDTLTPILLARCAANLNRTIGGFREPTLSNVREEVLGRMAVLLVAPNGAADFFEVKFALSLARLRIDVCHQFKRSEDRLLFGDDGPPETSDEGEPSGELLLRQRALNPEEQVMLKQMLSKLTPQERDVLLLHRLGGIPINAGPVSLVTLTGLSERTVRNRLRSAEASLTMYMERGR